MKNLFLCSFMLMFTSILTAETITPGHLPENFDINDVASKPITEVLPRGGLPNFFGKLQSKAPEVTIAYFGGSITEQDGYRVYSAEYLQKQYPETKINSIHAAIGGTDSELGAFRCGHDVLVYNPDLVIVEFAVNDFTKGPYAITRSMEGIIRQIWHNNPACDIMFVYTVVERDWVNTDHASKQKREVAIMERIADYYDIPTVDFAKEILGLVAADKLVLKASKDAMTAVAGDVLNQTSNAVSNGDIPVNADGKIPFAHDGVHPHLDTGHVIYENVLERSWPAIIAASTKQCAHNLPEPMMDNCLQTISTLPIGDSRITRSGNFQQDPPDHPITSSFLKRFSPFFSFEPGAEISFKFKGSKADAYALFGPTCGTIEITVDDNQPVKYKMFDPYCTWSRLVQVRLADGLDPNAIHAITIKVTNDDIDKRAILFPESQHDFDEHPQKYIGKTFYVGCFFIVGEPVNAQ